MLSAAEGESGHSGIIWWDVAGAWEAGDIADIVKTSGPVLASVQASAGCRSSCRLGACVLMGGRDLCTYVCAAASSSCTLSAELGRLELPANGSTCAQWPRIALVRAAGAQRTEGKQELVLQVFFYDAFYKRQQNVCAPGPDGHVSTGHVNNNRSLLQPSLFKSFALSRNL